MAEDKMVKRSVTLPRSLAERIDQACRDSQRPFTSWCRVILKAAIEKDSAAKLQDGESDGKKHEG